MGATTDVSVPVVDGLAERKVRPDELFADTAYGSGRNAFESSRRGTELVSPVAGSAPGNSHEGEGDGLRWTQDFGQVAKIGSCS